MLADGIGGVRRIVYFVVLALVAGGCRSATAFTTPTIGALALTIRESPSPFREVTAGPVRALIPDAWRPVEAGGMGDPREGIIAGPAPSDWAGGHLREGMAALWVDGARVGVPSDYYYLAATNSALDLVTGSSRCSATRQTVIVNHAPAFATGSPDSPGDYIAMGGGRCTVGRTASHWRYFIAAPGYGPARGVGIPSSGLYVVVAVMPDSPRASHLLGKLLVRTEFDGATMSDFIAAVRQQA